MNYEGKIKKYERILCRRTGAETTFATLRPCALRWIPVPQSRRVTGSHGDLETVWNAIHYGKTTLKKYANT